MKEDQSSPLRRLMTAAAGLAVGPGSLESHATIEIQWEIAETSVF